MVGLFVAFLTAVVWLDASGRMAPAADGLYKDPCYYGESTCRENLSHWQQLRLAALPSATRYLPPDYPRLSALEYGLEAFVPIFDFGQRQHWEPASPFRLILAVVAFLGIFFGSLFAAAVSGLLMPRNT